MAYYSMNVPMHVAAAGLGQAVAVTTRKATRQGPQPRLPAQIECRKLASEGFLGRAGKRYCSDRKLATNVVKMFRYILELLDSENTRRIKYAVRYADAMLRKEILSKRAIVMVRNEARARMPRRRRRRGRPARPRVRRRGARGFGEYFAESGVSGPLGEYFESIPGPQG